MPLAVVPSLARKAMEKEVSPWVSAVCESPQGWTVLLSTATKVMDWLPSLPGTGL